MSLLRAAVQGLLDLILGLAGVVALFAGLAMLGAALLSLAMGRISGSAEWLTEVFVGAAIIGAVLLGGGMLLAAIKTAGSTARRAAPYEEDPTLSTAWVWPATVPTLLLPALAAALSWKLVLLWRDILLGLDRLGVRADLAHARDWSNWALLPLAAALCVPSLEALSAALLVALPPLLLLALIARAPGFRMSAQRVVTLQAMFVGASLVGTQLFTRLAARLEPEIRRTGGPEVPAILESLARGLEVLTGTAWGHTAVLAGYGVCLWVLTAAQEARRVGAACAEPAIAPGSCDDTESAMEPEPSSPAEAPAVVPVLAPALARHITPPASPAVLSTGHERVSDLPQASRQAFEEKLARFRAGRGPWGDPTQARAGAGTGPAPIAAREANGFAMPAWQTTARTVLRAILLGLGALMLTFGLLQLATPRARFTESSPAPGASLPRPPASIVVRFSRALNPAASISVHRTMGLDGDHSAAGTIVDHTRALDRGDATGRSLRLPLAPLTGGVYRVDWRVMAAGRADVTYGHYFFAVGTAVPDQLRSSGGRPYRERDGRERGNRAALLSGVMLLVLAVFRPEQLLRRSRG